MAGPEHPCRPTTTRQGRDRPPRPRARRVHGVRPRPHRRLGPPSGWPAPAPGPRSTKAAPPPSPATCSCATSGSGTTSRSGSSATTAPASSPASSAPGDELIQSWDMTFKDTAGTDYVVGQVWFRRGADCYLLDQVRDRMSFTATCRVPCPGRPVAPGAAQARRGQGQRPRGHLRPQPDGPRHRARGAARVEGRPRGRGVAARGGRQRAPAGVDGWRPAVRAVGRRPDRGGRGLPERHARRPGRRAVAGVHPADPAALLAGDEIFEAEDLLDDADDLDYLAGALG